jgi:hypothetical protein
LQIDPPTCLLPAVKVVAAALLGVVALAWSAAAAAGPQLGFAEDATKYSDDGGDKLYAEMNKLGATVNRVAVFWDADEPTTIQEQGFLDRMVPVAARHGIQLVFAIYPKRAVTAPTTPTAVDAFCDYAVEVMQRYPAVRKVIIGNEPNQPRFWQPVFNSDGSAASPAAVEAVLASCYDKLKAFDPTIDVIGGGLSPRGNDDPHAPNNASISPVRFIAALGKAYRASGRTAPLFDEWSWHCYPNSNTDPVETGYPWPDTGCVNAARVKLSLWDAFHDTGQAVTPDALKMFVDEVGWQVDTSRLPGYVNTENVATVTESQQADDYAKLVHLADCDPTLTDFNIFHEIDEASRTGFQSGVLRSDYSERPAAAAASDSLQQAIAADGGACSGGAWATLGSFLYSTTAVVPAYKTFPYRDPRPYALRVSSGGNEAVRVQAGEAFSYAVTFANGLWTTTLTGATRTMTATVTAPPGFAYGTATVVLAAETNPARASTVRVALHP